MRATIKERLKRLELGEDVLLPAGTSREEVERVWYVDLGHDEEIDIVCTDLGVTAHMVDSDNFDNILMVTIAICLILIVLIV